MKVITVVGARPQFIKAAVVSRALVEIGIEEAILHTGQHFDANMSAVFFAELGIPSPEYELHIGGGSPGQNTGRMLENVEGVLLAERPDWVVVYGDTDSTLAGALAAVKLHIPVAHVEAGLRSFNRRMPEEINRILTDNASDLLLTPTSVATQQLVDREGIAPDKVHQVGDVMYDAALFYGEKAKSESSILKSFDLKPGSYVLATVHRADNTDNPECLQAILDGFSKSNDPVVWPIHPRTRHRLADFGMSVPSMVRLEEPVGYLDMVMLQKHARLIATDSGGVQKEAYFHKTPCITLRNETEWTELVEMGVNRLVGCDCERIAREIGEPWSLTPDFDDAHARPYGDGTAGKAIAATLMNYQ